MRTAYHFQVCCTVLVLYICSRRFRAHWHSSAQVEERTWTEYVSVQSVRLFHVIYDFQRLGRSYVHSYQPLHQKLSGQLLLEHRASGAACVIITWISVYALIIIVYSRLRI